MTSLRQAWAALPPRLKILEPVPFSSDQWSLVERLHADFNDREAHYCCPCRSPAFARLQGKKKRFMSMRSASTTSKRSMSMTAGC